MTPTTLVRISLRAFLAWCVVSAAGFVFVHPILRAFMPLLEFTIDTMQSGYRSHLSLIDAQGISRIVMSCTADRPISLPSGEFIPPNVGVNCAYMDAVHALVPIVIFLVTVVGWPAVGSSERRKRTIAALIALPCVVMLTTPIVLVSLENMGRHPEQYNGARGQLVALMQPFAVMEMGGRWLLPLVAAVFCIRVAMDKSKVSPTIQAPVGA
jgi:hypothetical protein